MITKMLTKNRVRTITALINRISKIHSTKSIVLSNIYQIFLQFYSQCNFLHFNKNLFILLYFIHYIFSIGD